MQIMPMYKTRLHIYAHSAPSTRISLRLIEMDYASVRRSNKYWTPGLIMLNVVSKTLEILKITWQEITELSWLGLLASDG